MNGWSFVKAKKRNPKAIFSSDELVKQNGIFQRDLIKLLQDVLERNHWDMRVIQGNSGLFEEFWDVQNQMKMVDILNSHIPDILVGNEQLELGMNLGWITFFPIVEFHPRLHKTILEVRNLIFFKVNLFPWLNSRNEEV